MYRPAIIIRLSAAVAVFIIVGCATLPDRLELKKDETGHEQLLWHGWEKGEPVVYTHEPHTDFWRRFGIGFMSIWPIESKLYTDAHAIDHYRL